MKEDHMFRDVEKVIKIPDIYLLDITDDGKIALISSNHSGSYQLSTVPTSGGPLKQITFGQDRVVFADISHRTSLVAFSRDFQGKELHQIYGVPLKGGKEEKLADLEPIRVFDFYWSPDDSMISFCGATKEANFVWLLDVEKHAYRPIYKLSHRIFSPRWNHDGSMICVSARTTDDPKAAELVFLDPSGKDRPKVYTPKKGSENTLGDWHPKELKLIFKTDVRGIYELAVYDLEYNDVTYLKAGELGLGVDFTYFGWMPDGKRVWYVTTKKGRSKVYIENIEDGQDPVELPFPSGNISGIEVDRSGSFAIFSWSSLSKPPSLEKFEFASEKLENIYDGKKYSHNIPLGHVEETSYTTFDGREIHGFFVKPKEHVTRRACVMWIHGGPAWQVADEWNPAIQALAVAGYKVFCPNFRGSTGYGVEFQNLNVRDIGGGDLKDVVEGVKYLRSRSDIDPNQIAIVGASYGGYMTFLAMTKVPDLWVAGCAIVGVTDWLEMYELSDAAFRSFIEKYFGKPEENKGLYLDRSPINFVEKIKAPILVWHRGNDSRCPLKPVEKFVKKLKELGKPHEFYVVWDEGHGFQKVENLVKQYKHVINFLNKHTS